MTQQFHHIFIFTPDLHALRRRRAEVIAFTTARE
jgi:hypothetical protein